jgi:CDP-paratose 2-epimerase
MYEHVLITGGAGFVGSSLALRLRPAFPDARLTALDNLSRRGSELNLPRLAAAGVRFVHGDVRLPGDLALDPPPGLILDCAADPSVLAPACAVGGNLLGTYHCLEQAVRWRADVLFLSTSRVYPMALLNQLRFTESATRFSLEADQPCPGASAEGIAEDFPLHGARSFYGMTKLASEMMLEEYAAAHGLRYIVNRCSVIAGPWQMGKIDQGVAALWMIAHYFRRPLSYIGFGGSGKQVRDVLHIDDLADLVLAQIDGFDRYAGQCSNVGGGAGNSLSLVEATALCREITGNTISIDSVAGDRPNDVRVYVTDARRIRERAGWRPRRGLQQIFADLYQWLRAEEGRLAPVLLR